MREIDAVTTERDRWKKDYFEACALVAKMHAAAVGEVTGPKRGVVEDVEDLHTRATEAEEKCCIFLDKLMQAYADLDQAYPSESGLGKKIVEEFAASLPQAVIARRKRWEAMEKVVEEARDVGGLGSHHPLYQAIAALDIERGT